jgi:hypothetical protein
VPAYWRSRQGRVFRVLRSSELIAPDRIRFTLRAQAVGAAQGPAGREVTCEMDVEYLLDKLAYGQAVPTPEGTFETLWLGLQKDLDG